MSMPPQIQALMEDRQKMMIAGGAVIAIIIVVVLIFMFAGGGGGNDDPGDRVIGADQKILAKVDQTGKAIEIQALLAREGIRVDRAADESGKSELSFMDGTTFEERDRAILALVQSGLVDGNVGLEAFDNGDLTASREEKRIKLIRAQQGELARLIRKIKPVEEASVHLSIPDPSVFRRDEKPTSASVQVVLPVGERLTRDKVRSIVNLMVASVQGLTEDKVAIADTNGNTYNSVVQGSAEMHEKLEERDAYMRNKVTEQLNKLVGPGHFVVTVSTQLREAPMEVMGETYEPTQSAVTSKQQFTEQLNSNSSGGLTGGPVSTVLPESLKRIQPENGSSNRGYTREGVEVDYANSRRQWVETSLPGMIEDISIAVTIDGGHFPNISEEELRTLIARAASPKVSVDNVSLASTDFQRPSPLSGIGDSMESGSPMTGWDWIPWAAGAIGVVVLLVVVSMIAGGSKGSGVNPQQMEQTHQELAQLRELTAQQQAQFQAAQQQTYQLIEQQQKQLTEAAQNTQPRAITSDTSQLKEALAELAESVRSENVKADELDLPIKSWIES